MRNGIIRSDPYRVVRRGEALFEREERDGAQLVRQNGDCVVAMCLLDVGVQAQNQGLS